MGKGPDIYLNSGLVVNKIITVSNFKNNNIYRKFSIKFHDNKNTYKLFLRVYKSMKSDELAGKYGLYIVCVKRYGK